MQCSEQVAEVATVVAEHYNEPVQGMVKVEYSKQGVVEKHNYLVGDTMYKVEEGCSGQGAEMKVVVGQCSKLVEEEVGVKGWDTLHMGEEEAVVKGWDILHMEEEEEK